MLHVCASAALYRPVDINGTYQNESNYKSPAEDSMGPRNAASSCGLNTNTTHLSAYDDPVMNKKYIEQLFLEESKNRINDYYNTNKFSK